MIERVDSPAQEQAAIKVVLVESGQGHHKNSAVSSPSCKRDSASTRPARAGFGSSECLEDAMSFRQRARPSCQWWRGVRAKSML
jgi:hypothetical protein